MIDQTAQPSFRSPDEIRAAAHQVAASEPNVRPLVFAEGSPQARLMIVGEGPGADEEAQGRPFVGPAGRLLNAWLSRVGIDRRETWVTNVVKTRKVAPLEGGRLRNRSPLVGEVRAWLPVLSAEIALVRPQIILCLGAPAAKAIIARDFRLTEQRGQWFSGALGARAIATFHPAYILRLEGDDRDRAEALVRRDLSEVAEALLALEHEAPAESAETTWEER